MMDMTSYSHCWNPGQTPWRSQIYSLLLPRNWREETMGRGITILRVGDVSWILQNGRNWECGNHAAGVYRQNVEGGLCVAEVSWILKNGRNWQCGNGGAGAYRQNVEVGLSFFANASVRICWRWETSTGAEWATIGTFCLKPTGGRKGRDKISNLIGREEGETQR